MLQREQGRTLLVFELMLRDDVTKVIKDVKSTRGRSDVDGSVHEHKSALLRRIPRPVVRFPTFLLRFSPSTLALSTCLRDPLCLNASLLIRGERPTSRRE